MSYEGEVTSVALDFTSNSIRRQIEIAREIQKLFLCDAILFDVNKPSNLESQVLNGLRFETQTGSKFIWVTGSAAQCAVKAPTMFLKLAPSEERKYLLCDAEYVILPLNHHVCC